MRRLLLVFAAAACAWAQDTKIVQKIIELKYADANRVANLVHGPGPITVVPDLGMHVLVVRGPADSVASIEEMVKQLDVAPPNIELTVFLLSGSPQAAAEDLPKDLASTAKQLHGTFAYKSYRMLESFVLRGRDGREARTSGVLPGSSRYDFHYRSATVSSGTPRVVHIDALSLNVRTPTQKVDKNNDPIYDSAGLGTDIDVGEGQKVVVGKSNVFGSDDAMILVVTAKVVE
jgi:hypothetical protein